MKIFKLACFAFFIGLVLLPGVSYGGSLKEGYYTKGTTYALRGKFEEAKKEFENALSVDPYFQPARLNLQMLQDLDSNKIKVQTAMCIFKGIDYGKKKMYDEAIAEFNKAIEYEPGCAKAYLNRGIAYLMKGRHDEALEDYDKAIELDPALPDAHLNRGTVYVSKGMYAEAIADYTRTIELDPNIADAYYNRGGAYHEQGLYDMAIADYDKVIEVNPDDAWVYFNKAISCEASGKSLDALGLYKKFVKEAPPDYYDQIKAAKEKIKELKNK